MSTIGKWDERYLPYARPIVVLHHLFTFIMKTQLLFLCVAAGLWSTGLRAQLTNESFEQWHPSSVSFSPVGWQTSNDEAFPDQVVQVFDGHYGAKSVMLSGEGVAEHPASVWQSCNMEEAPSFASFYVKGHLTLYDSVYVVVCVRDLFGNDILSGSKRLGPNTVNPSWQHHTINFNPVGVGVMHHAEVHIYFTSDSVSTGFVQFDDVHFELASASITDDDDSDDGGENRNRLDVRYNGALWVSNVHDATTLSIFDMSGRLVEEIWVPANFSGELPMAKNHLGPCVAVSGSWRRKLVIY